MPLINCYLPHDLYTIWKQRFRNKGEASAWLQIAFKNYNDEEADPQSIDERIKHNNEIKTKLDKENEDLEQTKIEIASLKKANEELAINIDTSQLINLVRVLKESYGIGEDKEARRLAIAYLAVDAGQRDSISTFLRKNIRK
jgi:hypothetical protein